MKAQDLEHWAYRSRFVYWTSHPRQEPQLVVFGEEHRAYHEFWKNAHLHAQAEVVRSIRPRYVLHEAVGIPEIDPSWGIGLTSEYVVAWRNANKENREEWYFFLDMSKELGFELVECDDKTEGKSDMERELAMAEIMVKHVGRSDVPVVAILGAHHSCPGSFIHDVLSQQNIRYTVIQQHVGPIKRTDNPRTMRI